VISCPNEGVDPLVTVGSADKLPIPCTEISLVSILLPVVPAAPPSA